MMTWRAQLTRATPTSQTAELEASLQALVHGVVAVLDAEETERGDRRLSIFNCLLCSQVKEAMKSSAVGNPADAVPRRRISPVPFLLLVALSLTLLYRSATPAFPSFTQPSKSAAVASEPPPVLQHDAAPASQEERLERVLSAAATPDRIVILTSLNAFWATPGSVLDLFLESFRIGDGTPELLDHLVIVAVDDKAYARCRAVHRHCFDLKIDGVDFSGEKVFNSPEYLDMMWARLDFLRLVLEKGYSFIFSDVDVMWFRNPLPHFYQDGDLQISCDEFMGDPANLTNWPNNGFNYVKSNARTVEFYKFWHSSRRRFPGVHEQNVLNIIKFDPLVARTGLKIRFLGTDRFGGFCEISRDLSKVCTMHANCCIGLSKKIDDLRAMLADWRKFSALPPDPELRSRFSWSIPQSCRLPPEFFIAKQKHHLLL